VHPRVARLLIDVDSFLLLRTFGQHSLMHISIGIQSAAVVPQQSFILPEDYEHI